MRKTFFVDTLGNYPRIKILDFLMENSYESWTLVEIMKNSKVGYATLKYTMPLLLKKKIVLIDKKVGKAKLYKINTKNEAIRHLMAFDWALIKQATSTNMVYTSRGGYPSV